MTTPKFSVIIPLYNKRPYVRRAVDSVLAQSLPGFELIVVDDGSTDCSADALATISDTRLRLIRQPNRGVGPARNRGMQESVGSLIAFLDADDAWLPEHLKELAELEARFPAAGLLSTSCVESVDSEIPTQTLADAEVRHWLVDYFAEAARSVGFINSTSAAVSRAAYRHVGGFIGARAGEDLEYWARVALDFPVAFSKRVTCVYFRDTGGAMHNLLPSATEKRQPITSLRELSPSVALLCDRASSTPDLWRRPSISLYVNSRLENGIRGALYRGEIDLARSIAAFMMPPLTLHQRLYNWVVRMPRVVLLTGLKAYVRLRKFSAPPGIRLATRMHR